MIAEPLPGTTLAQLIELLRDIENRLSQTQHLGVQPPSNHRTYLLWAHASAEQLAGRVTPASLDRLVLTRRYWTLQEVADQAALDVVTSLRNMEVRDRQKLLAEAVEELAQAQSRWHRGGRWVVPDTSFHINHPQKIDALELDDALKADLELFGDEDLRILVPILVVDELDNLKRDGRVRGEAQRALAILARLLANPHAPAVLRPAEQLSRETAGRFLRGEVTVELLLDPPGHARLPIADDELVSRAVEAQTLIGKSVYLVTYDTGQAFRAKAAGLEAVLLRAEDRPS